MKLNTGEFYFVRRFLHNNLPFSGFWAGVEESKKELAIKDFYVEHPTLYSAPENPKIVVVGSAEYKISM